MIRHEQPVAAEPAAVWGHLSRLDDWHRLLPTVDEVTRLGPEGPVAVGTRFRVKQPGLVAADYTVTDWRPGSGFTWESRSLGVHTVAVHTLRAHGPTTQLALGIGWTGPMAWLVRPLVTGKARRYLEQEAAAFAALAEGARS